MVRLSHFASLLLASASMLVSSGQARAATYYVDSARGLDTNSGGVESSAWKTLGRVNGADFKPGDRILFASGSVWHEQLAPRSSGAEGSPIVLDRYGQGAMPNVAGDGTSPDAVLLRNVQQIEVHHLEITNRGTAPAPRRGVHLFLDNYGTARAHRHCRPLHSRCEWHQ